MRHQPRTKDPLLKLKERLALLNLAIAALEQYEHRVYGLTSACRTTESAAERLKLPVVLRRLGRGPAGDQIAARVASALAEA